MPNLSAYKNKSVKVDRTFDNDYFQMYYSKPQSKGWMVEPEADERTEWENSLIIKSPRLVKGYGNISSLSETPFIVLQPKPLQIETSEGIFYVDSKLNLILDEINGSKSLLNLSDDWDGEDAIGCNSVILDRAINILLKYSQNVLKYHNTVILPPEINLGKDGSIDIEWRSNGKIFLFNVINSETLAVEYYGNDLNSKTVIKGVIENYSINRTLSFWMQNLI